MRKELVSNRAAFVAAAFTALIIFLALELSVRARFEAESLATWTETSFLAHEQDDHGRVMGATIDAARIQDRTVHLIGGSTLREGLLPDQVIVDTLMFDWPGATPSVNTLYSFDQSLAETARIALNLDAQPGDVVVLNINPRRFSFAEGGLESEWGDSRLSLLSAAPLEALRVDDGRSWQFPLGPESYSPWNSLEVFKTRLFTRSWIAGRLPGQTLDSWAALADLALDDVVWSDLLDLEFRTVRRPLRYAFGSVPLDAVEKEAIAFTVATERVPAFFENRIQGFHILELLIDRLQGQGAEVVLLELPRSPISTEAYGPVWADYNERVIGLAADKDLLHIDLRGLGLPDSAFYDLEHVLAEDRRALSELVFGELEQLVAE